MKEGLSYASRLGEKSQPTELELTRLIRKTEVWPIPMTGEKSNLTYTCIS